MPPATLPGCGHRVDTPCRFLPCQRRFRCVAREAGWSGGPMQVPGDTLTPSTGNGGGLYSTGMDGSAGGVAGCALAREKRMPIMSVQLCRAQTTARAAAPAMTSQMVNACASGVTAARGPETHRLVRDLRITPQPRGGVLSLGAAQTRTTRLRRACGRRFLAPPLFGSDQRLTFGLGDTSTVRPYTLKLPPTQ